MEHQYSIKQLCFACTVLYIVLYVVQSACIVCFYCSNCMYLSGLLIFGLQSTDIRVLDSVLFLCYLMLMFFFALLMLIFSRHSLHWSIESQALHTSQSNHFYQHLHFWLPICNKSLYERRVQICLQKPLPGCQDDKINLFQEPFLIHEGPK